MKRSGLALSRRKLRSITISFGLFLVLSGCSLLPIKSLNGSQQRKITIAWIPKALDNPVFDLGRKGAIQRAAELTAKGPVEVEVLFVGSVSSDALEQVGVLEDMIARGVDGIAISCNDPVACKEPIDEAVEKGIPVMTWDADSPQSKRFTYLGLNNREAGMSAGKMLAQAMGEKGKVAILTGVPGAHNLEERVSGFRQAMVAYPDIHIVTAVYTNDDINLSIQVVEETMQAYPDLSGWFFAGMWPLMAGEGAMPLWENAALHLNLKTVAFDSMPEELDLLQQGYISGLIDQKTWTWGYDTVQILCDHIISQNTYPSFLDSGFNVITANNVQQMKEMVKTNDFSQVLPPP